MDKDNQNTGGGKATASNSSIFTNILRGSAGAVASYVTGYVAANVNATASSSNSSIGSGTSGTGTSTSRPMSVESANIVLVHEITGRGSIDDLFDFEPVYDMGDHVARYPIFRRDGTLILHGPLDSSGFSFTKPSRFQLILHHPTNSNKMFTLLKSNDQSEALATFDMYKDVLSVLIKADNSLCERHAIERICSKLQDPENVGWTAAHVAAAFDYHKLFVDPKIRENINQQEGIYLRTPVQIAILHQNYQSVVTLVNLGAQLDRSDSLDNTILHHAVQSSSQIFSLLVDNIPEHLSLLIDATNRDGSTPLHLACRSDKPDIVKILLVAGANVHMPSPNPSRNGEYPIHTAVKTPSLLSIQELLLFQPKQINLQDSEGSSPLHWAVGHESIKLLLELGCDPNLTNKDGQIPLHFAARRGCLKSCLTLLCHHAFPDLSDKDGDTPLHIASRLCFKIIIQVLIVFGADVNVLNKYGYSGRHLICTSQRSEKDHILFFLDSVGAARCPEHLKDSCTPGCLHSGTFCGIPPENYNSNFDPTLVHEALYAYSASRKVSTRSAEGSLEEGLNTIGVSENCGNTGAQIGGRLLCLDGGGIRGIVLTQILLYMEREFGTRIVDLFDWIAGTSTGGILALCLATGKSALDTQALYLRLKNKVFTGTRPYNSDVMDEFLKKELGSDTKMCQILRPRVMITTSIVDRRPADFDFFRNYLSPSKLMGERGSDSCTKCPDEVYIWEAAKATGAAPSYFRLQGKYVDGGLVSNNPTIDALTELTQFASVMKATGAINRQLKDFKLPTVVVSLGTGVPPIVPADVTHFDLARPSGIFDAFTKIPKFATLFALLVEQTTQTEGQVVERARAWCASIGIPYFRYSPPLSSFIDLDETNDEVLVNLMWETRAYLHAHRSSIIELKNLLFRNGN